MAFKIDCISFRTRWMRARFPFRYGIASMTELPHLFVLLHGSVDGMACTGLASEGLFAAADESVFSFWQRVHGKQAAWAARHAIPSLLAEQVAPEERANDGLPQALADAAAAYGLTHFKIKVAGQLDNDIERLSAVAAVLERAAPGFRFTLDGNEKYGDLATFREHWEAYRREPALRRLFGGGRLLFVEQPLHRDAALTGGVGAAPATRTARA